jgi:hypothetical protein
MRTRDMFVFPDCDDKAARAKLWKSEVRRVFARHHEHLVGWRGLARIASCGASRNFEKVRPLMESYVAVSFPLRDANRLSIYFVIEWSRVDWFLVSLLIVAVVILSLMLHLPLQ